MILHAVNLLKAREEDSVDSVSRVWKLREEYARKVQARVTFVPFENLADSVAGGEENQYITLHEYLKRDALVYMGSLQVHISSLSRYQETESHIWKTHKD